MKDSQQLLKQNIEEEGQEVKTRKYLKGKLIGVGGFAKCYEGTDLNDNSRVAIKVIEKNTLVKSRAKQKLLSEIKIHKILHHPNIVRFLTVFQDQHKIYIVTELCENQALSDLVRRRKRLSLPELISAMEYLHSLRIIHRDIKMANIFLDKEVNLKLGDFGLSAKIEFAEEKKRTMCGTPNYIAPEIIQGESGHSYEVDIWSTGVICYAMMFGRPPFETSDVKKTYEKIKNCQFDFGDIPGVTIQAKDFIKKILVLDPKKRMSFADMSQHPFLRGEQTKFKYNLLTMTPIYQVQMQFPKITASNITIAKDKYETQSTLKQQSAALSQPEEKIKWNFTKVISYVDYSTKYGLGYLLSSHVYGVYFNDSSLLTFDQKENFMTYIDNPSIDESQLQSTKYFIKDIDNTHKVNKKYLLLKRFKFYLDQQHKQNPKHSLQSSHKLIYVKQWLKTKHSIMFRLNNKLFQVQFFDGSSITLNTELKYALVRSKKGIESTMAMEAARSNENAQIAKRINYIRQILHNLKNK